MIKNNADTVYRNPFDKYSHGGIDISKGGQVVATVRLRIFMGSPVALVGGSLTEIPNENERASTHSGPNALRIVPPRAFPLTWVGN